LDATADHYALKYDLAISEDDDGYQWMQVTDNNTEFYFVKFEHKSGGYDSTRINYTFPMTTDAEAAAFYSVSEVDSWTGTLTDSNHSVNIGNIKTVYVIYDASGTGDDDWYKDDFVPYIRAIDTTEPQLLAVAPMAGGTYAYGDDIYVSLIFDEIIKIASGVTIDTNLSDSSFIYEDGEGTNVLVFKGTVNEDNLSSPDVEDISITINNSSSIKDLSDYDGTSTGSTEGSTDIDVNTVRPTIIFKEGSSAGTLPKHNAVVEIKDAALAKYAWTKNTDMPVSGLRSFPNMAGGTLTEALADGIWHLHILATHANGNTRWEHKAFAFQQPIMSVAADNTNWARSRNIALTVTNSSSALVTISMTGEGTDTYTGSQNVNVTANGTYTFTLTDSYGSSIVKSLEISKIDRTMPEVTLNEYGNTETKYTSLDFGASAADEEGGSGLSDLQYAWTTVLTNSGDISSEDWITVEDGSIPTYDTVGTAYLHIKAVDNAGNTAYDCSQRYTVVDDTPPTITVTGAALSEWQKDSVSLGYTVTKSYEDISYINAAGTVIEDTASMLTYPYTDSINISENGLYTFTVIDKGGLSDTKNAVVNFIDNEAPVVAFSYGDGKTSTSWAQGKTITINANDNTSPVIDLNGSIASYSGSGLSSVEWKRSTDDYYAIIGNGGSFNIVQNGVYDIKATDTVGNISEYALSISGVDTFDPIVSVAAPTAWQKTAYNAIVTYSDDYSGIASAKYAITSNNTAAPAELFNLPESGGSATVSANGSSYIYYEVSDNAGNTNAGWSDAINVDTVVPELTVSANEGTAEGEGYTSGQWTSSDVVFTLGNSVTQISGTTYQVSIGSEDYEDIPGNTYTITEDTNATYRFKAVSGGGKESGNIEYTVKIDKTQPDINLYGNPTVWQNTDAELTLAVSDSGISGQTVTVSRDGSGSLIVSGINYTVSAKGSYVFTVTTGAGKTDSQSVNVSYIDKLTPDKPIITDVPAGWQDNDAILTVDAYDITANSEDGKSEVASFVYSVDGGMNWSVSQEWNISGPNQFTVNTTGDYTDRIIVKVTDNAGNTSSESVPYTVKLDKVTPELTVSSKKGTAEGETYTSGQWTSSDVVFTLGNSVTQISGTTYQVSIGGEDYVSIPGNTYTITEDTNAIYRFKAVSGSGKESGAIEYEVNCDSILPIISSLTPANRSADQSINPSISFTADEQMVKGNGYLTIYNKRINVKVMDIHSSNNRVKLSNGNKTVNVTLPQTLFKGVEYYIVVDEGFVTDRAGNKAEAFGGKDIWYFKTALNPVIPDREIAVLGYTVELISKADADAEETRQTLTAVTDKEVSRQHNIIAKASYSENGMDYYLKLRVIPTMSAVPEVIDVLTTEGTAALSGNKKYIDVLIPQSASEAVVTISLGSGSDNKFSIKIINSSYRAVVETSGDISAAADESNLINSVDLSKEMETAQQPNTTVDVTLKMIIEQKEEIEIPESQEIEQAVPGAAFKFLDITIEKIVTTTIEGISSTTESEAITVTQQPVVIIIDLPLELQGRYNYMIVREHNGEIEILSATAIDNGTRLRFETDRFSTYSIAYKSIRSSREPETILSNSSDISSETITSVTAEGNRMMVDAAKLDTNTEAAGDINTLIPYFEENNQESVVGISAVVDGQLKWIAQKGRTYRFKYNTKNFNDIQAHWARNDIIFNSARELFDGTAAGIFSPDASMTRGMFVTVLGRLWEVGTSGSSTTSFEDVVPDAWYAPYVEWAAEAGIVKGYGNGLFGPDDNITREQMTLIIARFAEYTGLGLNKEDESVTFVPKDTVTRAETAAALRIFIENAVD
jgi:hypothetical protein